MPLPQMASNLGFVTEAVDTVVVEIKRDEISPPYQNPRLDLISLYGDANMDYMDYMKKPLVSQEIQTKQDTSIIAEPVSETADQDTVFESKLILPDPEPTIAPEQSSIPAVSKISVIIHANNSVKIYPVHDFVQHLDLSKILQMDSNISPALFGKQTDNPVGPPPLISNSDEDEDVDFRPAIPIQHPVQFVPIHNSASAVKTMVFVDDICIFDRDQHGLFIPVTSISTQNITTYLHFWLPPPAITTQLSADRNEDTVIHHHTFATVETVPSPVHQFSLRYRGETPRSPVLLRCSRN
jgi:hypothetical protein